jgi:hypothetical protein
MSLIYENKIPSSYRTDFANKVISISRALDIDPNWLMAIMYFESARTFSPSIQNPSGATGLIQFMPSTAIGLGTTTDALKRMSAVQQLDYVYKYYLPYKSRLNNYIDLYLVTFFPAALGKPDDFVIQSSGLSAGLIGRQNPSLDVNNDGVIQVWEIKKKMLNNLPSEWVNHASFSLVVRSFRYELIIGATITALGLYLYIKNKK